MTIAICGIEPSVQMRLYTLNKRHFFLVFATITTCFFVSVMIGVAGPPVTERATCNGSTLQPPVSDLKRGPFYLESPPLTTFHQHLWLTAQVETDFDQAGVFELPFQIGILVRGVLEDEDRSRTQTLVYNGILHNHTRTLICTKVGCDDIVLVHLGFLSFPRYTITIDFFGLKALKHNIIAVNFQFITYNPAFTHMEIWFRFAFLLMTFFATCLFAHSLRKFSLRDWAMEQRWMSLLLPLLLLYNNPMFPLTFLANSWIPGLIDGIFQASFLATLLLFWLCIYHGLRLNKHPFSSFYLPKLLVTGSLWIGAIVLTAWEEYHELHDPTYNYRQDMGSFMAVKVFFLVSGAIYMVFLVYNLVRAFTDLRSMPYFDLRLKFTTCLMLLVLLGGLVIVLLRFGIRFFFSSKFRTHYNNSAEFLSLYALLNLYTYTMAFLYSPSRNAVFESHFKDNPALSMFNDSDEDVVYGSESEETTAAARKSLVHPYDSEDEAFN